MIVFFLYKKMKIYKDLYFPVFVRLNVASCVLKKLQSWNKPYTAKTKNTLLKSKIKKNKKTSLSEDSNFLGCDVFDLSKIAFEEGDIGFGGKIYVSI